MKKEFKEVNVELIELSNDIIVTSDAGAGDGFSGGDAGNLG